MPVLPGYTGEAQAAVTVIKVKAVTHPKHPILQICIDTVFIPGVRCHPLDPSQDPLSAPLSGRTASPAKRFTTARFPMTLSRTSSARNFWRLTLIASCRVLLTRRHKRDATRPGCRTNPSIEKPFLRYTGVQGCAPDEFITLRKMP